MTTRFAMALAALLALASCEDWTDLAGFPDRGSPTYGHTPAPL